MSKISGRERVRVFLYKFTTIVKKKSLRILNYKQEAKSNATYGARREQSDEHRVAKFIRDTKWNHYTLIATVDCVLVRHYLDSMITVIGCTYALSTIALIWAF